MQIGFVKRLSSVVMMFYHSTLYKMVVNLRQAYRVLRNRLVERLSTAATMFYYVAVCKTACCNFLLGFFLTYDMQHVFVTLFGCGKGFSCFRMSTNLTLPASLQHVFDIFLIGYVCFK